jgi:hypothetical protein
VVLDFVNTAGVLAGGVKLELVQLPAGEQLDHALAGGRYALETEDGAPDKVAAINPTAREREREREREKHSIVSLVARGGQGVTKRVVHGRWRRRCGPPAAPSRTARSSCSRTVRRW